MSDSVVHENTNSDSQFAALFGDYKDKIYRLAGKFFKNRADREDIVQETFLRVYTNLHRFDNSKNAKAWIYRIGTNICIDTLRRRTVQQHISLTQLVESETYAVMDTLQSKDDIPEDAALKNELIIKIERLLNELPSKWKPFIYQHYILEMTYEEMSIANNIPVSTIKSRMYRARTYLQRCMQLE
ncbi:sigma-70 family RNA polymerase sigma factor [Paenibacillus oralis]|uniref:Sigma-70 family RNA polymerase sigma factor n=1 Tax=Paenibacillus oralis TaxID=2490856 RepID=A0A3P3TBE6_9BACL|nr:sigma-70 family RNA polymerase sigma factor [Paenibacillus oralis]RRJ54849.1 sigma-70 family RNA polymerase sigma factor [Paenibacillus oralis]